MFSCLARTALPFALAAAGAGRRLVSLRRDADARCGADAASARAQAVVTDNSISISPGDLQNAQCESDRQSRDAELLAALAQVTNWRRHGDVVELQGVTPLRFRLMTN
jgi:hypothetical protein